MRAWLLRNQATQKTMADILQLTEDIPVDDSIYDYEYKEYNPITGAPLNRGSIVITIESQDIYTHPAESFLVIEGKLGKMLMVVFMM